MDTRKSFALAPGPRGLPDKNQMQWKSQATASGSGLRSQASASVASSGAE